MLDGAVDSAAVVTEGAANIIADVPTEDAVARAPDAGSADGVEMKKGAPDTVGNWEVEVCSAPAEVELDPTWAVIADKALECEAKYWYSWA